MGFPICIQRKNPSSPRLIFTSHPTSPQKKAPMPTSWPRCAVWLIATVLLLSSATRGFAACCYFSAKDKDIQQPGQLVFITWDPAKKLETFTVQPKFEG